NQVLNLWKQVKSEISDDPEMEKLPPDLTILGEDFFDDESMPLLKIKISDYITFKKLQLEKRSGLPSYPMAIFGVASSLAISLNNQNISESEFQIYRSILVISILWEEYLLQDLQSFCELIGVDKRSYFATTSMRQDILEQFKKSKLGWV